MLFLIDSGNKDRDSREIYFLETSRENESALENLVCTVRTFRCASNIFSFASPRRAVSFDIDLSDDDGDKYVGAFCEVHHHFGSPAFSAYVYLLNLYTVSFVDKILALVRSRHSHSSFRPIQAGLLDWLK